MGEEAVAIQRRITACFAGRIDRDCVSCFGHHTKKGRCCFGLRYDSRDTVECLPCKHRSACAFETSRHSGVVTGPNIGDSIRPPMTPTWSAPSSAQTRTASYMERPPAAIYVGDLTTEDTAFATFAKHIVWKALEGFFRGAYEYFYHTSWSHWRP